MSYSELRDDKVVTKREIERMNFTNYSKTFTKSSLDKFPKA